MRGGSNRVGGWETRAGISHAMWTTDVFGRTLTSMPSLTGAVSRDGRPGATFTRTRAFTAHDVASFASITGDHNPIHVDPDAARIAGFEHGPVVHGMLCASMFGAIIGTKFPGAVYATQSLSFRKPVRVNEVVRAEVEVTRVRGGRVQFATRMVKEDGGDVALDGDAMAMIRRS